MKLRRGALLVALLAGGVSVASIPASSEVSVNRSENIRELSTVKAIGAGADSSVWDAALQGDVLAVGLDGNDPDAAEAVEGLVLFRRRGGAPYLKKVATYRCRGNYGDVALWGRYAFIPVPYGGAEAPNDEQNPRCNPGGDSRGKSGVRIVDISDLNHPFQVGFVETPCGANRISLLPQRHRVLLYGSNDCPEDLPPLIGGGFAGLNVICLNPHEPSSAKVCSKPDLEVLGGCADFLIHAARKLGACVDANRVGLFDLSDPLNPALIGDPITVPEGLLISGGFTWDGLHLAITDAGVNTAGEPCPADDNAVRRVIFYNIEDTTAPVEAGDWALPRPAAPPCFPAYLGMLPMKNGRYLASIAYGAGGVSIVDFTQPGTPREIAHFAWGDRPVYSAYWYNGRIYVARGGSDTVLHETLGAMDSVVSVLKMKDTGRKHVHFFKTRYNPQTVLKDFR